MKQTRKMRHLVAEELNELLEVNGIEAEDEMFDKAVASVLEQVEALLEETIEEEVYIDDVYYVLADSSVGGQELLEGEFIQIVEMDPEEDTVLITIYDAEGEIKVEDVSVNYEELDAYVESGNVEVVADDEMEYEGEDEEDLEESDGGPKFQHKGKKKIRISAALVKLKDKLKKLKGAGINKFRLFKGKIVKKTRAWLKADKKRAKLILKNAKKGKRKAKLNRNKTLKVNSSGMPEFRKVVESFDLVSGENIIVLEAGDFVGVVENQLRVIRDGKIVAEAENITVDEKFLNNCLNEGVIEEEVSEDVTYDITAEVIEEETEKETEEETLSESASMLSYKAGKGYVLIRSGREIPMGNRVRARAYLTNEGFEVSADMLDKASEGKVVIL